MSFISDAWNALVGKPQSWYTRVSDIQNQLAVIMAGVTAAGSDVWNTVSTSAQGPTQDGSIVSGVDSYSQVVGAIDQALKSIIVTTDHVPDDATISSAQDTASKYQGQLEYVTSVAPEVAAQIQADQQKVSSILPGPMQSPSVAGRQAFEQELEERAKALGQGAMSVLMWVAAGLLGIGLLSMARSR